MLGVYVVMVFFIFVKQATGLQLDIIEGNWKEGLRITLQCENSPYTGVHEWRYDSAIVFSCDLIQCIKNTDDGDFEFDKDLTTGIFKWTISQLTSKHIGKVFACYDGQVTAQKTATFIDLGLKTSSFVILFVIISVIIIATLGLLLVYFMYHPLKKPVNIPLPPIKSSSMDTTVESPKSNIKAETSLNMSTDQEVEGSSKLKIFLIIVTIASSLWIVAQITMAVVTSNVITSVVETESTQCWVVLTIILCVYALLCVGLLVLLWCRHCSKSARGP